ncbi:hypothetical protein A2U01_0077071, partial [Trifolium medium]|nr:hypothetical protein [Trifolium medium]
MSQINARPGMEVHQVLCRRQMPHLSRGPSHLRHSVVVGDVLDSPDSKYLEHDSDAPAVSWSVPENAPTGQSAGGTADSMTESEPEL